MSRITNPLPQLIPSRVLRARARVQRLIWGQRTPVDLFIGPINADFIPLTEGMRQPMRPLAPGEFFGPKESTWGQCWAKMEIPAAVPGEEESRFFLWEGFGENTVFHNGTPWWGIDWAHKEMPLPAEACTLWMSCGLWHGATEAGLHFTHADISVRHELAWQIFWDLEILVQLMVTSLKKETQADEGAFSWACYKPKLETLSPFLRQLLRMLDDACDEFDQHGLAACQQALQAIYQRFPAETWQPELALNGHAHIDLVWLWPEAVANQKGMHTFASQLRLMERYPEFKFTQSQPALYRAVEKLSPELVGQIKGRIAEGRWEATGASEVELDTLVPSGEAMARSVIYGQRKFRELRGSASRICWIPDVFGYSASLPQILHLAGVPFFFTTKMTWSTITKFPYNSFVWRGSDGSEVLTHLCTRAYIGQAQVEDVIGALAEHQQTDLHPELLYPSGHGDGGGGVTIELLERARRIANLSGVPQARWSTAEEFFDRMDTRRDRLPIYQGELYLEYHRGTYTTQSEFKRLHRAGERHLQIHEAVRVATGGGPVGEEAWLRVLFAEFHDALPGSSIRLVYAQLLPELEALQARVLDTAKEELQATGEEAGHLVFNPLPVARTAVVDVAGRQLAVQLPALGARRVETPAAVDIAELRETSAGVLDNGLLRAEFDAQGQLSAVTLEGERMPLAAPGHFALYFDDPHCFDAWDIDHYTYKFPHPAGEGLSLEVLENTPLRAVLRGTAPLGEKSTIAVSYILEAGSRWLRIEAEVDWQEAHQILRYHLPTEYRGRWARFGNPFGSIQRAQQPGVQADEAMWEVPGNRWAAVLQEDGRGMAIVTEAKYGFSCKDGDLGLSLLRSTKEPDPEADMGQHHIRFAVGRHEPETHGERYATPLAADILFTPPLVVAGGGEIASPFTLEDLGSLTPAWVLPSETGSGYLIRLHETNGSAGAARLQLTTPPQTVTGVDFLENNISELPRINEREFDIPYQPYQIISILVR